MAENIVVNGMTYNGVESVSFVNESGENVAFYPDGGGAASGSGDTFTLVNNTGGIIYAGAAAVQNGGATQLFYDSSTSGVMLAISAGATVTKRMSVTTTAGTVLQNFWGQARVNTSDGGVATTYYLSMIVIMGIMPGSTVTLTT